MKGPQILKRTVAVQCNLLKNVSLKLFSIPVHVGVYVACQTGPNLLLSRLEGGTNEKGERSPGLAYTYVDVVRHCCCYINHPIR